MNSDPLSSQRRVPPPITVEKLDAKFDGGEDVLEYFDVANARVIEPNAPLSSPRRKTRLKPIAAEEIEAKFDAGEDISGYMHWDNAVMVAPGEMSPGMKLSLAMEAEEARKTQNLVPPPPVPDVHTS